MVKSLLLGAVNRCGWTDQLCLDQIGSCEYSGCPEAFFALRLMKNGVPKNLWLDLAYKNKGLVNFMFE